MNSVIKYLRYPVDWCSAVVKLLCMYCMEAPPACKTPKPDCTNKIPLSRSQQTVNLLLMITDRYKHRPISMIITGWLVLFGGSAPYLSSVSLCLSPAWAAISHCLLSSKPNTVQSVTTYNAPVIISTFTVPLSLTCSVSLFSEVECHPRTLQLLQTCRSFKLLSLSVFSNGSFMWTKTLPLIADDLQYYWKPFLHWTATGLSWVQANIICF